MQCRDLQKEICKHLRRPGPTIIGAWTKNLWLLRAHTALE
jgi:hypothetical protein